MKNKKLSDVSNMYKLIFTAWFFKNLEKNGMISLQKYGIIERSFKFTFKIIHPIHNRKQNTFARKIYTLYFLFLN